MASPFLKISQQAQDDHTLYGEDASQLSTLKDSLDPRVVQYCETLRYHKRQCPICSWPRLYPAFRRFSRLVRKIVQWKVF